MEFNYFDLVVSIIILLLGLKGVINGFFKEAFGLLGIIGGIFIASRIGDNVGQYLSNLIFKFENSAAINFTGFLVTLAVFWLFMIAVGYIFKRLSILSGLGAMDKVLGFIFGASKFFLIAAVIAYAAYNIKIIKDSIDSTMDDSILFPVLVKTGGFIMKLDSIEISDDINETIDESVKTIQDKTKEIVDNQALDIINKTKEEIKNQAEQITSDTSNNPEPDEGKN